jgi:hypothetical protein
MTIVDGLHAHVTAQHRSVSPAAATAQVVLRSQNKQAYACEVYPREAVSDLIDVAAVYAYARAIPANRSSAVADASGHGLHIGYIGTTDSMGRQDELHGVGGHFDGHGFDIVLVHRVAKAHIRADIARDLVETFNPVLNDLLRGLEPGNNS